MVRNEYVGVSWNKQCAKWRAYVCLSDGKHMRHGKFKIRYKFIYVGLFDSVVMAAAARETAIESNPTLTGATRNQLSPQDRLAYENYSADPDVSPLTYTWSSLVPHPAERWEPIPKFETDYHVSNLGSIRAIRNWGTALVAVKDDTVTLTRAAGVRSFRVSALISLLFPKTI